MAALLVNSPRGPLTLFKPAAFGWRHVEPGVFPYVDQSELYVEVIREGFEISEEDQAGLLIEVQSDFLLAGINVAINNVATGQVVEDERRDSSGKLLVGRLVPGNYELIVYTHECITNMDPAKGTAISSFDLLMQMSVRLLREDGDESSLSASVPVETLDFSSSYSGAQPTVRSTEAAAPLVVTPEELMCQKEYQKLPTSLDGFALAGAVDLSEAYYSPTLNFHSHEIAFTAKRGQDALRVLVASSHAKLALYEHSDRSLVAQSRPVDGARAQLLVAQHLRPGTVYTIMLEFSEEAGMHDEEAADVQCDRFFMSIKTWDSQSTCSSSSSLSDDGQLLASVGAEPQPSTLLWKSKSLSKDLKMEGGGPVDLKITVDYSDGFFRPELALRSREQAEPQHEDEDGAATDLLYELLPSSVDFSRKHSTTYHFTDLEVGNYFVKLRQRFKESGCASPATITVVAQKAAADHANLRSGGVGGLNMYQSQSEEQENPRLASQLPLDLGTYKFLGGEASQPGRSASEGAYVLFSGPVQLSEHESQNRISFKVEANRTLVRFYAEHAEIALTLKDANSEHPKTLAAGTGSGLSHMLDKGQYTVQLALATAHARKSAELLPPQTQLTVMVADADARARYHKTWETALGQCDSGTNFPLALRQQK